MTDTNEKIRSLVLTALMVFSVFAGTIAFSGGAAAAANVDIDQAVEYSPESGTNPSQVEVALSGGLGSDIGSGDVQLYLDGQNPAQTSEGNDLKDSVSGGADGRIVIELNEDVQPSRNLTVKLTDLPDGDGNNDETLVAEDIDVTSRTFTTTGDDGTSSAPYYSGDTNVFRGETIAIEQDAGLDPNAQGISSIEVEADDGGLVSSGTFEDNSEVYVVETSDLDTGESYNISVDNRKQNSFTVSDLDMQVNIDDDVGDGANIDDTDTLAVNVSINRGGEPANATLFNEDDEKVTELDDGVDNPQFKSLQSNDNVVFNFGSVSDSDSPYYVEVTDQATGVTAESDLINVSDSEDGDASFETSTVQDEVGDVANITVQLDNTEDGIISVGSTNDDNYAIVGQIEDEDGDGEVTVQFNSYTAGTSSANSDDSYDFGEDGSESATVLSVPGDDDLEVLEEEGSFDRLDDVDDDDTDEVTLSSDTLEAGSYSMNVTATTDEAQIDDPDSVGTLRLNENSVENIRTWTAPSDADIDDDDVDIYDRIGENLTEADNIAVEDVVVHEIQASGIEGALEYQEEDNSAGDVTAAFDQAVDTDGDTSNGVGSAGITLYVNRSDVGANADADPVNFGVNDPLTVVEDADNNTYFVAVDTGSVEFTDSGDQLTEVEDTRLNATFSIKEGPLSEDDTSTSALYRTSERDATLNVDDDDLVTVPAAAGQEVGGETNVAPGSELEIEMESENDANPFVLRPEADVDTNGTYTATADFSDYSAGTNFTVQTLDVDGDEDFSDEENGRIVEADTATVSISDQESDGSEVVVDSAQLSDGGFIVIHDSTLLEGEVAGSVVGNSEYLEAGSHEDITITLDEPQDEDFTAIAMPHLDTNGNEAYDFPDADGPYTANGSAVTDAANVTVVAEETETEPPETETEPPETETEPPETEPPETEPPETEEPTTTAEEGPGFTAAIALIALIAAALLAVRRDN